MLTIRKYQHGDEYELRKIFFNTIRRINITDYSQSQVQAWAPDNYDEAAWFERVKSINPFVAVIDDEIVGYADVQDDGYIDQFFCHWLHQGKGIGKALMQTLDEAGKKKGVSRFYSHVSITAKPFFEHFGFNEVIEQQIKIRGQALTNFVMERIV